MAKPLWALVCGFLAFGYSAPVSSKAIYEILSQNADPQVAANGRVAPDDPRELELDHFLCFDAKTNLRNFEPIEVSLVDHFETSERRFTVKTPKAVCVPSLKEIEDR